VEAVPAMQLEAAGARPLGAGTMLAAALALAGARPAWAANASAHTFAGALLAWAAQVATAVRSASRDRPGWVAQTAAVDGKGRGVVPAAAGTTAATAEAVAVGTTDPGALWDRRPTSPTT